MAGLFASLQSIVYFEVTDYSLETIERFLGSDQLFLPNDQRHNPFSLKHSNFSSYELNILHRED